MRSTPDKPELKEFILTKLALQEMLEDLSREETPLINNKKTHASDNLTEDGNYIKSSGPTTCKASMNAEMLKRPKKQK